MSGIFGIQLLSTNIEKAAPFYEQVFGWKIEKHPMGFSFFSFPSPTPPHPSGGAMMQHPMPGLPSAWLTYITVNDIANVMLMTPSLGGQIIQMPLPSPLGGLFGTIADPTGAVIGVFQHVTNQET
jgi:predicted enzyme related to lactoylglutathione lyase